MPAWLLGAISQGVLWGVMVLGLYITYKILDLADLTVDGSFALGGAVSAILIVNGWNPFLTFLISFGAGLLAGACTGLLHTVLRIPAILSGILTMISLYSINIRIMGKANIPLLGVDTMVTKLTNASGISSNLAALLVGLAFTAVLIGLMYWFFGTEIGCSIRATGNNEAMVRALGSNTKVNKVLGLMLSNALVSLSGALVAQSQGYADVQMGQGAIVIGLASIIIGEVLFGHRFNFAYKLASVVCGSVIYRVIIGYILYKSLMQSTDLKLLTAVLVAAALSVPIIKEAIVNHMGARGAKKKC